MSGLKSDSNWAWQMLVSEEMVSAMQAAAEASNAPFLLLLDALNEAADPAAWRRNCHGCLQRSLKIPGSQSRYR